jgi:LmbE family N-acetylglucosaminyl deacetylase
MNTIIGFAAHPDDLEFSCTATFKKLKDNNYQIVYVIVTNGENGFKVNLTVPKEERIRIRKLEQKRAAEKLGADELIFLEYQDGRLEYSLDLREKIVGLIKKYKPQFVFSFDPANKSYTNLNVMHRDHRVLAEVVFDSCFAAKNLYMYPGEPHRVQKLYFFASDAPNHFEDITDLIDFKLELLACHESQFPDFSKVESFIKNEVSNQTELYKYSEAFRVLQIRQIT